MRISNGFTFFYGGAFSNWADAPFTKDGILFRTSEHYMMYKKAMLFGDEETAALILQESLPWEAKALGRKVRNFDESAWMKVAREIVYEGCYEKFTQNQNFLQALLATDGTTLVEASPTDKIWGIGLAEKDDRVLDPKNWKGTNWLGEVLTKLRDDIEKIRDAEEIGPRVGDLLRSYGFNIKKG